jgi:ubiquinone/menaquinone biosynthesis C-methylase UbiE
LIKFKPNQEKNRCILYYKDEAKNYDEKRFSCDCNKIYDIILKNIVYNYLKDCNFVLDAGTGTGRFAIHLAKKGVKVVALDGSREMILVAQKKSKRNGIEDEIYFVVGDVENLPFKTEAFDGLCSIYVLIHFISRDKIISEFSRIVKIGGIIVFDVPNKMVSKIYWHIMEVLGKNTFVDYQYNLKSVKELFSINSINVLDRTKFIKMPRLFIHFFICTFGFKFLIKFVEKLENYNFGATSVIKVGKVDEDINNNPCIHSK